MRQLVVDHGRRLGFECQNQAVVCVFGCCQFPRADPLTQPSEPTFRANLFGPKLTDPFHQLPLSTLCYIDCSLSVMCLQRISPSTGSRKKTLPSLCALLQFLVLSQLDNIYNIIYIDNNITIVIYIQIVYQYVVSTEQRYQDQVQTEGPCVYPCSAVTTHLAPMM